MNKRPDQARPNIRTEIYVRPSAYREIRQAQALIRAMGGSTLDHWDRIARREWAEAQAEAERVGFDWRSWLTARQLGEK